MNKKCKYFIEVFVDSRKCITLHPLHLNVKLPSQLARVAELVDALDSKSCAFGRAGSIPAPGTKQSSETLLFLFK